MNRLVIGILLLVSAPALGQPSNSWTIPGTVNVDGQNGTRFVSDLALTNPGNVATQVTVSFIPAGGIPVSGTTPKQVTLNAGATVVYRNLLDSLWGAQGSGATLVASDVPLLIRARTYNTAASGTYGVALPVFADDRLLSPGDAADSLWISQSAAATSGYRTNVAVVFPDAGGGAAMVTVYDGDGNTTGSRVFSLDAAGFQQFGVGGFAGAVPVGRATIRVTRGRAAGYSVVNDNVTGDSSLFTFEDLPEGYQDVLVNGVARAVGKNDTFFRTDGRFYNPATMDATVTVAFHANQATNSSPLTQSFIVPAGKIRDIVDILDSLLGLPAGSSGALRFSSAIPVAILCRTSNVDPTGLKPGTFGAQQKPIPLLAFQMSADAEAAVTGIRQSTATDTGFRTNVGFAAGGDGATYALTLKTTTGETVATATPPPLGAFGWTQPNVKNLFPGTTIPDDATLLVKVTSGSVDVFDSSIDNASGDSVVTPIMPLPVGIPSAAGIGPQGGSIRSDDGRLTLKVPAGALSSGVALSFVKTANGVPQGAGSAYKLSPGGLAFAKPALLSLAYARADVEGGGSGALGLAFANGGNWYVVTGGAVNPAGQTLTVPIASTTPPTSSRPEGAARKALDVPFDQEWAPFLSRVLLPQRTVAPEGAKVSFGIFTIGPSASDLTLPNVALLGLPVNPKGLLYNWYVNDALNGNTDVGTIQDFQNVAGYTAPHCVPGGNPVQVTVEIVNPSNSVLYGITNHVKLPATVKVLPKHWQVVADLDQYSTCLDSTGVAQRQEWKNVTYDFDLEDSVVQGPDGPILKFMDVELAALGVKGKTTAFAACPPTDCTNYVGDPPKTLIFSDLGGSYDIRTAYMTFTITFNAGQPVTFPGWNYTCHGTTFHFAEYGSYLGSYLYLYRPVLPGFFVAIDQKIDIPMGGYSISGSIQGQPCH